MVNQETTVKKHRFKITEKKTNIIDFGLIPFIFLFLFCLDIHIQCSICILVGLLFYTDSDTYRLLFFVFSSIFLIQKRTRSALTNKTQWLHLTHTHSHLFLICARLVAFCMCMLRHRFISKLWFIQFGYPFSARASSDTQCLTEWRWFLL